MPYSRRSVATKYVRFSFPGTERGDICRAIEMYDRGSQTEFQATMNVYVKEYRKLLGDPALDVAWQEIRREEWQRWNQDHPTQRDPVWKQEQDAGTSRLM